MTSWWRLKTQVHVVLTVLVLLIVFLGFNALSEAKRHVVEADELLGANFTAASLLKQIENARLDEIRTTAKYRVTKDVAYDLMSRQQHERVNELIEQLWIIVKEDEVLAPAVQVLREARRTESASGHVLKAFTLDLRELERMLEVQRLERADRLRRVAKDLKKIITVTFVLALGVTSWLILLLYFAVLKPLESIKRAAQRIREGELSYRIETFHGVRELSDLRSEFNSMASKLEELDRMKGDFLSTVSHELRTPLTAIKEGLNFLTEKQAVLPASVSVRTLEVCSQSAKRLETMIQNLLNHAKMESGFYSFDERPKDFITVVESAIQGVKPIAERRGLAIELKILTSHHMANFSTEGITHALENLLLNAIKYGDASHPLRIEVSKVDAEPVPQLEVRVTNHGKGLLPSELKLVFERFFRASNADGQKGVGLGLSVVKRIIESHHGTVAAESANGLTTFSFRIPQRYESQSKIGRLAPVTLMLLTFAVMCSGCASLQARANRSSVELGRSTRGDRRLIQVAVEMLDSTNAKYDPEKGKTLLEYLLKHGVIKNVELPAPALLELLRGERVAVEKSRNLEQQLEVMKEIDLKREEAL